MENSYNWTYTWDLKNALKQNKPAFWLYFSMNLYRDIIIINQRNQIFRIKMHLTWIRRKHGIRDTRHAGTRRRAMLRISWPTWRGPIHVLQQGETGKMAMDVDGQTWLRAADRLQQLVFAPSFCTASVSMPLNKPLHLGKTASSWEISHNCLNFILCRQSLQHARESERLKSAENRPVTSLVALTPIAFLPYSPSALIQTL